MQERDTLGVTRQVDDGVVAASVEMQAARRAGLVRVLQVGRDEGHVFDDDLRVRAENDSLRLAESTVQDAEESASGLATAKAHAEAVIARLGRSAGWSPDVRWTQ